MWGRAPDLSPSGAAGSTIAPGAATLWLKRLPGQQLGPVSTNPWQRLDWGRKVGQGGGAGPLCWILYKEKRCEQCGLGFTVCPVDTGRGTQRCLGWAVPSLGPGAASGPFWPWWAWLLVQVSGQWAGWEWGAGRKGRTFWPYLPRPGGGGVQPARQASSLCLLGEGSLPQA